MDYYSQELDRLLEGGNIENQDYRLYDRVMHGRNIDGVRKFEEMGTPRFVSLVIVSKPQEYKYNTSCVNSSPSVLSDDMHEKLWNMVQQNSAPINGHDSTMKIRLNFRKNERNGKKSEKLHKKHSKK
jgi:hypothetical protein